MLDSKLYIERNAATIAENCIKNLLWTGTPCRDTIDRAMNHARKYHYCSVADLQRAVLDILQDISQDEKSLHRFISQRMQICISPYYRTAAGYISRAWETTSNPLQICNRIAEDLETCR